MSDAPNCIFCRIIRGEIPSRVVEQDADVIVFLSLENHPIVVTKQHVDDIFSLSVEQGAAAMRQAIRIAGAMRDALRPDGIYLSQSNGAAAGEDVFHFHLHLWPRWSDGRVPRTDDAGKDEMCRSITAALAKSTSSAKTR